MTYNVFGGTLNPTLPTRSRWMVLNHVMRGRSQSHCGQANKILLVSVFSSIRATCPNRVSRHKTDVRRIEALDQWCLSMLVGIKWYHVVQSDDVRRQTKQPKLTAIIQLMHRWKLNCQPSADGTADPSWTELAVELNTYVLVTVLLRKKYVWCVQVWCAAADEGWWWWWWMRWYGRQHVTCSYHANCFSKHLASTAVI